MTEELEPGTRVEQPGYGRRGTLYRYETAYRTRWAVVCWDGKSFTNREYPSSLQAIVADQQAGHQTREW